MGKYNNRNTEYAVNGVLMSVRKKPWWFRLIPGLWGNYANTIFSWIYVSKEAYNDLHSDNPQPETIATMLHEAVHLERQKSLGYLRYGFRYLFFRSFRFEEELLAIMPQMHYLKHREIAFDVEARARALSSSMYLWCASYQEAFKRLNKVNDSN